jgi:hypothetical protein
MNIPRQKKRHKVQFELPTVPSGTYVSALANEQYAIRFARIITEFEHLESQMPRVLAELIGIKYIWPMSPAGYIWRVLRNPSIKTDVLRRLLEMAPNNKNADEKFDQILSEYDELRTKRNHLAHGLWFTNEEDMSVYLAISDPHGLDFMKAKPIPISDLDNLLLKIRGLLTRIVIEL